MDRTDKRILSILEKNARTSAAEVGRQIGLSRTAVQDRVTKLERLGTIAGYQVKIAQNHDHRVRAVLFITIAMRPCQPALQWLAALEGVTEVISLSGDIDAIIKCAVPDINALSLLNDKIGTNALIARSHSSVVLQHI